ncbi:MAG: TraR/DksA C4-type zinc finger protein [Planctomycetes bacterium]|nr:TraR/DksA C4-type zinc finger protein [Planctomycetota bacterium]
MAKKGEDKKSAGSKTKKAKVSKVSKSLKDKGNKLSKKSAVKTKTAPKAKKSTVKKSTAKSTPTKVKKTKSSVKVTALKKAKPAAKKTAVKPKATAKKAAVKPKAIAKPKATAKKAAVKPKATTKPRKTAKKAASKRIPSVIIPEKRDTTPFLDADLKKWKKLLVRKKQEIFNRLGTIKDESYSDKSKNADIDDIGDASSGTLEQSFNLGMIDKNNIIIFQIDSALERIVKRTFGVCVYCDAHIPLPRLNALPYTPYCLICADKPHNN